MKAVQEALEETSLERELGLLLEMTMRMERELKLALAVEK